MSEIVKNEMDAIAAFAEDTEKRRSTLTLNELNYISDKQLHKKDGGGGGGLPVASASNEGQALVSTKKYVKGATVIPQQTVTTVGDEAQLDGLVSSLVSGNQQYIVVVNNNEYIGVAYNDEENHEYILDFNNYEIIFTFPELGQPAAWFIGGLNTEYTVAVYVLAESVYSWEPDPYAGYDIIFQVKKDPDVYLPLNEIVVSDIEIVKGSIEALEQKLLNGYRVNGLFEVITSYSGNGYDSYNCWQMAYFDTPYRVISFGRSSINGASSYTILTLSYKSDYTLESITFGS